DKINLHRIEIDCRTENEASRRVIEKCGLTYEGVFRDFFWRKDHFEGRRVFSILKSEYEAGQCDEGIHIAIKDGMITEETKDHLMVYEKTDELV
ncbi:MAG: GNAT family N-acetyltransferase, partial [Firmicutes bacterium]|nr:GNAT family N-acetyltransferase [Bacillota bacterium]